MIMARRNRQIAARGKTEQVVSTAIGAAEAVSVGMLRLTETALIEAVHTVQDIGGQLGSVVMRAARGSIRAAQDIGGDIVIAGKTLAGAGDDGTGSVRKPAAKAAGRRRRAGGVTRRTTAVRRHA